MQPPQAPPNSQTHKLGLPKSPPPLLLIFSLDYRHGAVLERISVGIFGVRLVGVLERIWWGFLPHDLVGIFASNFRVLERIWSDFWASNMWVLERIWRGFVASNFGVLEPIW